MKSLYFPLYNADNGTFMIMIFVLVCIALIIAVVLFMSSAPQKKSNEFNDENKEDKSHQDELE